MSITYNFSEYSEKGNVKTTNNNSCKAVKTINGDLFIIADVKGDNGKQAADVISDTIIKFFSDEKHTSLKNALREALQLTQENLASLSDPNDVKKGVSIILFNDGVFTTASVGEHRVMLFSSGKIHHITDSKLNDWNDVISNGNILLKKGDVLISSSNGLIDTLNDAAIEDVFNTDESVAFKTKHLLDNSLAKDGSDNISIQTIEITGSEHYISVFTPVSNGLSDNLEAIVDQEDEESTINLNITDDATPVKEDDTIIDNDTEESIDGVVIDTEDTRDLEEELDSDSGFSFKKILYFLIPLLLAFLLYKYIPTLKGDDSNTQEEIITTNDDDTVNSILDTIPSTESENTLITGEDSIDSTTDDSTSNSIDTANQQNSSSNSVLGADYFIIGENNRERNTYKNIYQFTKRSGSSLSMEEIIALNPNYKAKKDGDKVYLK